MSDDIPPEPKNDRHKLAKTIATFVIGGAIGSVLGLAFAPQRGSDTRKVLKKKANSAFKKGQIFLSEHEKEIGQIKKSGLSILSDLKDQEK